MPKIIALALSLLSFNVIACSCLIENIETKWKKYTEIHLVQVTNIETIEEPAGEYEQGKVKGKYQILESFKGNPDFDLPLLAVKKAICCTCSMEMKQQKYLLFSSQSDEVYLSSCGPSVAVTDDSELIKTLRALSSASAYKG